MPAFRETSVPVRRSCEAEAASEPTTDGYVVGATASKAAPSETATPTSTPSAGAEACTMLSCLTNWIGVLYEREADGAGSNLPMCTFGRAVSRSGNSSTYWIPEILTGVS